MTANLSQLLRERIWHLSLQLSSLLEFEPWVLSWSEHVVILNPAELRKRVRSRLTAALK